VSEYWAVALTLGMTATAGMAQTLGDPTRPTSLSEPGDAAAVPQGPRWRLQSILVADDRRVAVINGRAVAQGGRVDGAIVLEVRSDGVTLDAAGERIQLRLPGSVDVKRGAG
jgi:MSHA biogenesis protein MshK